MGDRDQLIVALERELHRLRCQNRRLAEELDWRDEKIRVLTRVMERLIQTEETRWRAPLSQHRS